MKHLYTALAALALAAALSACGGGSDDDNNDSANGSNDAPDCADVLVVGAEVPEDYEGCQSTDDSGEVTLTGVATYGAEGNCDREIIGLGDNPEGGSDLYAYADERVVTDVDLLAECSGLATEEETDAASTEGDVPSDVEQPSTLTFECPEGLEDGNYTLQEDGLYVDPEDPAYPLTYDEALDRFTSFGCELVD